jgi:EAL domain-containing protein (putative c-di-GMP-specific phosphodiesterase class I)
MSKASIETLNCLVLDDSVTITAILSSILMDTCHVNRAHCANCAQQALDYLDERPDVDLVFLDLNMPDIDGMQFIRLLKEKNIAVAIVLISGSSPKIIKAVEGLIKLHKLDLVGSIPKPITEDSVSQVLYRFIKSQGEPNKTTAYLQKVKVHELLRAIEQQQFEIHYQPIVNVHTGRLKSAEALLRLRHPSRGMLYPDSFISELEAANLMRTVTLFVIDESLKQWGKWHKQGIVTDISLNIPAEMLGAQDLPEYLLGKAEEFSVPPGKITIEVTETCLGDDEAIVLEVITRLSINGFKLSLDDFGTGFSTVERLQHLPFHYVKIDKQFMLGLGKDESKRAALESSISMARRLGMKIVVEGVETLKLWDVSNHIGVDYKQGYFIAMPMPASAFNNWFESWNDGNT